MVTNVNWLSLYPERLIVLNLNFPFILFVINYLENWKCVEIYFFLFITRLTNQLKGFSFGKSHLYKKHPLMSTWSKNPCKKKNFIFIFFDMIAYIYLYIPYVRNFYTFSPSYKKEYNFCWSFFSVFTSFNHMWT